MKNVSIATTNGQTIDGGAAPIVIANNVSKLLISDGASVYHVVLWIEDDARIGFALGLEGALTSRGVAERCAEAYRERFASTSTRVGILEMPAPDPRMKHPEPRDDVEQIVAEIRGG